MLILTTSTQHFRGGSSQCNQVRKKKKIWEKTKIAKLLLFVHSLNVYIEKENNLHMSFRIELSKLTEYRNTVV